jgi:spermidine synthase
MRGRRPLVVFYTVSGAAALVYEVAWTRLLTLQLGHTVAAATTVLAAFMGGLAIGAWAAGAVRGLDSWSAQRALTVYAALELAVAATALLLPVGLRATIPILAWAYSDGQAAARFAVVRVVISLLLVGAPAAAMGATFPITAAATARSASDAGTLYAANTTGAAIGAIAAGFWLIPALGLRQTTWIGVALNLVAAAGALRLALAGDAAQGARVSPVVAQSAKPQHRQRSRSTLSVAAAPSAQPQRPHRSRSTLTAAAAPSPQPQHPQRSRSTVGVAAATISGFSALVYEVAWTRLLVLVIGPTTYAFATMAASFITGLALGSTVGTRVARRTQQPALWVAGLLVAGGVAASVAAWYAATRMPLTVASQVADPAADFASVVWRQALAVGILLLPMTLALGATFPLALAMAAGTESSSIARDTARVYTANTIGAIAGALAAGFVLIPWIGLRETIRGAAVLSALGGALVLVVAIRSTRLQRPAGLLALTIPTVAALIAILAVPPWDRSLLASGAYKYAPYLAGTDLDAVLRAGTLVYYKEGSSGTVSVRDLTGTRSLSIDGKVDASNAGDMLTQRLLGLLPVLIHGHAKEIAVIGLGSGVTAGSALATGAVEHADVIEISPEVVAASHFFDKESGRPLARPGVRLIVGDGRSHLLLTPRQYDVIISEPSNPWMAGVASLFTREFFEAARARLGADGVICQWAHTYDIHPEDLRSIVGTFSAVFPQGSMWLVGGGDLLLIGAKTGDIAARLDAAAGGARQPSVESALADVGVAPGTAAFGLLSLFSGGPDDIQRFANAAGIQTDDRNGLEYSAPRAIYGRSGADNAVVIRALAAGRPRAVQAAFDNADDRDWASRGSMDLRAQAFTTAYESFRQAAQRNPRNSTALAGLSDAAGGAGRLVEEREWLQSIVSKESDNAPARIELSRVLAVSGDAHGALEAATEALRLAPGDPRAAEQLASVLADTGDGQRLAPFAEQLVSRFPERADSGYYRATALYLAGRTADAVAAARQVVSAHPTHARAQGLLGAACAALDERECAQAAFDGSINGNPRDASAYINAGIFQLRIANVSAAARYFASALALDPNSVPARSGLAQARDLTR